MAEVMVFRQGGVALSAERVRLRGEGALELCLVLTNDEDEITERLFLLVRSTDERADVPGYETWVDQDFTSAPPWRAKAGQRGVT